LQAKWAPNIVVGLGRLGGRTVGVIANNPLRKGGCLDSLSAEKAARFVRMCDSFAVPLLVLVDVPATCRAWARSGAVSSAATRSCCTPSVRPWCPG
jgi:acetyl-CoA carboxylase alpha subunit